MYVNVYNKSILSKMRVYSVEGAEGAGKSVVLNYINDALQANNSMRRRVLVVEEPVTTDYMSVTGLTYAQRALPGVYGGLYQCYTMQVYMSKIVNDIRQHKVRYDCLPELLFVERFPGYSNQYVFTQLLHDFGHIDQTGSRMLERIFQCARSLEFLRVVVPHNEVIDLEFVYVICEVERCLQRRPRLYDCLRKQRHIHALHSTWLSGNYGLWHGHAIHLIMNSTEQITPALRQSVESLLNSELATLDLIMHEFVVDSLLRDEA